MNVKSVLFLSILTFFACKNDDEAAPSNIRLEARISNTGTEIKDICTGKITSNYTAKTNKPDDEIQSYRWTHNSSVVSTEKDVTISFEGLETQHVFLSVTDNDNQTAGDQKLQHMAILLGQPNRTIVARDEYNFAINSASITNIPYTNEVLTFETEQEFEELWWQITDPDGVVTNLQGEVIDGKNRIELSFETAGTATIVSQLCEDGINRAVHKEISFEVHETLPFSKAGIRAFQLTSVAENTEVEASFEIWVDGTLQFRTNKKNYLGPNNQNSVLQWLPADDLEIGDTEGFIEALNALDTEIEIRVIIDNTIVITETRNADYLGHFGDYQVQKIQLGEAGDPYTGFLVLDSIL